MSKLPAQGVAEVADGFSWGEVITAFSFDLDGHTIRAIKYHPWKVGRARDIKVGEPNKDAVMYHNPDTAWTDHSIDALIVRAMTHKWLGMNQHALTDGLCRAMGIPGHEA